MKNLYLKFSHSLFLYCALFLCVSCQDDEGEQETSQPYNALSMQVGSEVWKPSVRDNDACMSNLRASWSQLSSNDVVNPYYTIWAYTDPQTEGSYANGSGLTIQFMQARKTGTYYLTGSADKEKMEFGSYAVFRVTTSERKTIEYVNSETKPNFVLELDEFLDQPGSVKGIKGSFYGTLYNKANPLDSLVIKRGDFKFGRTNRATLNQCAD